MKNLNANYEVLKQELDKKADLAELVKIENTKVSKEELLALLPSDDAKDIMKEEFRSEVAYFHKSIDELARAWDLKLVKLRKELDLFSIKKEINKRALDEEVKYEIHKVETKWSKIEQLIAGFSFEFDGVKDFVKKFGKSIKELQEVNKDVLLGKQNVNWLSCGRGDKKFVPTIPMIKGKDGRVYKGGISKGYVSKLDRSVGDADVINSKFFSNRRESSPPIVNNSHTNSRKQFSKPSSAFPRRRWTTALSRQNNSQTVIKKKTNMNESDKQIDSEAYNEANIYTPIDYDGI